jgi:hypothetical protein
LLRYDEPVIPSWRLAGVFELTDLRPNDAER